MNLVWEIYRRIGKRLPKNLIRKIRSFLESRVDFLWEKKFYGQFGEDAVLRSLFEGRQWQRGDRRHGKNLAKGFYVDVGACAPKLFSNTYLFYRNGWNGINIDATPGSMKTFNSVRKRDVNIETAVSNEKREMTFYSWGVPNVANTFTQEHAETFTKIFGKEPEKILLRTEQLEHILDAHLSRDQSIDFMSIDVENHNLEVLQSNNWEKYRPTFVIVESDFEKPTIERIINSEIKSFMENQRYHLCSWISINLVFEKDESV